MLVHKPFHNRQQGMTLISWLLLMALIGFIVLIILRMFPIYTKHYKIQGIMGTLAEEQNLYEMTRPDILDLIDKRLHINMVSGFKDEHFTITLKDNGSKEFRIAYEDRRHIISNIDVVVKFDDVIVVSRSGAVY